MIRFALIVYLSLTTVLRPALCCCMAKELLSGSTCCSTKVALEPVAASHAHKPHKNCRGHAKPSRESASQKSAKTEQKQNPCEQDRSTCPCGKSFASMAISASDGFQHGSVEVQSKTWTEQSLSHTVLPASDVQQTSLLAQGRHSDRYGREMLRAYQIMRC